MILKSSKVEYRACKVTFVSSDVPLFVTQRMARIHSFKWRLITTYVGPPYYISLLYFKILVQIICISICKKIDFHYLLNACRSSDFVGTSVKICITWFIILLTSLC
jgi:hypothetical protein